MFDWTRFLRFADDILDNEDQDEARSRSAISRAYYAAFHHGRRYVEMNFPEVSIAKHGGAHEDVVNALKQQNRAGPVRSAGAKLERLKRARKNADYGHGTLTRHHSDAQQAILDAKWVLKQLSLGD